MSLYIRVFNNFYTSRKTAHLRTLIGDDAFWVPPRIWAYAAENQPDGDLSRYQPQVLANLIGYTKDATSMHQALLQAGFLDKDLRIHDWHEHNGYHVAYAERAKAAANARWAKDQGRERKKENEEKGQERKGKEVSIASSNASSIRKKAFVPPTLQEAITYASSEGLPKSEAESFVDHYTSNGWKVGKSPMKDWHSALRNWKRRYEQQGNQRRRPELQLMQAGSGNL